MDIRRRGSSHVGRPALDERVLGGPWRFWVGYADDRPASCSAAYTDADVVGVFMVGNAARRARTRVWHSPHLGRDSRRHPSAGRFTRQR